MTDKVFGEIAATGVVGALLVLAIIAIIKLYYDLKDERQKRLDEKDARIEDAKTYAALVAEGQKEIGIIAANLGKVAEAQEKERDERLRLERELQFHRERLATSPEEMRPVSVPQRPGLPPMRPAMPSRPGKR